MADLLTVSPHTPTPEPVSYDKTDGQWYTHDGVDVHDTQQRKGEFSHINFIRRCLRSKVISKGFCCNFHTSTFSSRYKQYFKEIGNAQESFSHRIMKIISNLCAKNAKTLTTKFLLVVTNFAIIVQLFYSQIYLQQNPSFEFKTF